MPDLRWKETAASDVLLLHVLLRIIRECCWMRRAQVRNAGCQSEQPIIHNLSLASMLLIPSASSRPPNAAYLRRFDEMKELVFKVSPW